jgi:hypothetical protein
MLALLAHKDAVALVAVDRVEESPTFKGVDLVNLGPGHCLVYEIHYTLRYGDDQYSPEPAVALVPSKPHLVEPGDTYRILDKKVYGAVRERSQQDWLTEGLGQLDVVVKYVAAKEGAMSLSLIVDAKPDALRLDTRPTGRSGVHAVS